MIGCCVVLEQQQGNPVTPNKKKMDPVSAVEELLGPIETWPTTVVEDMCITEPHVGGLRLVATFMFGNGVPIDVASDCVSACTGWSAVYIAQKMHDWYYVWSRSPDRLHKTWYYNMRLKSMVWLNGLACSQEEVVKNMEMQEKEFGLGHCPLLVQGVIDNAREGRGNGRRNPMKPMFV
jgi:hypothetical protein